MSAVGQDSPIAATLIAVLMPVIKTRVDSSGAVAPVTPKESMRPYKGHSIDFCQSGGRGGGAYPRRGRVEPPGTWNKNPLIRASGGKFWRYIMPRLTTTPTRRGDEGRDDSRRHKLHHHRERVRRSKFPNPIGELISSSRGIVTVTASDRRDWDYCHSLTEFCQTENILC